MAILDCARAIIKYLPKDVAVIMVAIAGGESNYGENNFGDYYSNIGVGNSKTCNGYCSIGAWQINMCAHYNYLTLCTKSSNPCVWQQWLLDIDNNAQAATDLYKGGGFNHWTVYKNGSYQNYLEAAQAAVNQAISEVSDPTELEKCLARGWYWLNGQCIPPVPTYPVIPVNYYLAGAAVAAAVIFLGFVWYEELAPWPFKENPFQPFIDIFKK